MHRIIQSRPNNKMIDISFKDIMIELISLSYKNDIRNYFFQLEGKNKYEAIYLGNKEEFEMVYLYIVQNYFLNSIKLIIMEGSCEYQLSVSPDAFYGLDVWELESIRILWEENKIFGDYSKGNWIK